MTERRIWSIGSPDGKSADLYDNYKTPTVPGDATWRVPSDPAAGNGSQRWPIFHPSEADPEAGYRTYTYGIEFELADRPAGNCALRIHYLVIAPRLAYLEIGVNGTAGHAYFRPVPSQSGEIRLYAGLHTTIYSEGVAEVVIPGGLLRQGVNRLELTARDGGEYIRIDRVEKIKRLDRMANGAGFLYQCIALSELADETDAAGLRRAEPIPSVLYYRNDRGDLVERCDLYLEFDGPVWDAALTATVGDASRTERIELHVPDAAFGHRRIAFDLFDGEGEVKVAIEGTVGGKAVSWQGNVERRRKWKVFVTDHAHTDIGYTHRQWEVAERLCRNVDTAIDFLEAEEAERASRPDTAPAFAYHLDSFWVLETYLETRSERRKEQLLKWVKAGRINVVSNYVDLLTQYAALEDLIRNGERTDGYLRPHGMKADLSAVVDVASITGSMPAILEGCGVPYLVHANNQDRGPFRLNGGLHRVSPFYWEGTNGGKVLVWLAKMYCELRKVCGSPPLANAAERGLGMWLQEYETGDYAPDAVMLYGQEADNTDLDPQPNAFIAEWNAKYEYPKLIAGHLGDFFRYVEDRFGDTLRTFQGDGGAYWEDGAGSSIVPTIDVRHAQAMLPAAERLESLAVIHNGDWSYPERQFDEAWRELLLYDEHTWGAFLSCTDPEALLARDQWTIKEHMANGAKRWADRLLHGAATRHSLSWNNDGREVVVYNPNSWTFGGPVTVEIGAGENVYDAESGRPVPARLVRKLNGQSIVELWVDDMPGLSYRRLVLREEASPAARAGAGTTVEAVGIADGGRELTLENDWYRLTVSTARGFATGLFDKELGRELADGADVWGFGQLLYAEGGEGTRLVSNQSDLQDGDPHVRGEFEPKSAELKRYDYGTAIVLTGSVPYGELTVEWSLPNGAKRVDVRYAYRKEERTEKEAVYVAFPVAQPGALVHSDSQLGWVCWDKDQLPGGCKEWLPLQTGIWVNGGDADVFIASPDIPLFCVGDVVKGRWPKEMDLTGGRIFSYVLNNYWHTNYKASQGGDIAFRYSITSGRGLAKPDLYKFGWQQRMPLYAQRMSFQDFRDTKPPYEAKTGGTLARIGGDGVVATTVKKARGADGYVVRLLDIAGRPNTATVDIPGRRIVKAVRTDLLERELGELPVAADGTLAVDVPAWGLATVRIELA
ncbi:glycosyl hydrolase-related protein [Paenibacillus flagellatus]|uniref:Glycoside hydrolase family 38 N-terminal domain-containing protein n=1 Tax=Paenibacillus flagellatus TaxID=2211139 RepID=A0A2V5KVF6_9BACL|nr:glycosyl hydrolase-related protein [Paenibacillus flagellatus]PYI53526.1 hypothetical protein DLM86_17335 [Paenibacillus flagellatus]